MRVTLPNPLGPPITFDSDNLPRALAQISYITTPLWTIYQRFFNRRPYRVLLLIAVMLVLGSFGSGGWVLPSYKMEWGWEKEGVREGREGRYVRFDVPKGTGFNHQLQRILLHHHMAVLGNRSLVYEPFIQDETWLPVRIDHFPWRNAQIPLSAFIGTVVSGFERFSRAPSAVPVSYYNSVCPGYRTHTYTLKTDENPSGELELLPGGQARIHQLQVMLAGNDESCVRVEGNVFDDPFFDSSAPLELYDSFIRSPVMKHFTFSPTVLNVVNRIMPEIAPDNSLYDLEAARMAQTDDVYRTSMWKHVLAIHLRRGGDWEQACDDKAIASAPFVAFNKLPRLPGNENVPPPPDMVEATRLGLYRAKCFPPILEVIARTRRMRKNHPLLRVVYILTDGDDAYIDEMRMWLSSEGWDRVWVGKKDVYGEKEDREIGVAVDMEVARRAGVFVGNGFSTTSSNIVLLRQRDGIHPDLTQFW